MTRSGVATVARQEFRLRIRAGRWKLLLALWTALLVLFTATLGATVTSAEDLDTRGAVVYGGLVLFVLGLALLVVPSLSAQSVNGDRERGTLATLQVTRLSAGEIAVGKLLAAWGTALVFLALSLPMVAYAASLGGVSLGRVVVLTAVLALLLGTVCSVSLWLSSVLSRTSTSGVLAYLAVATLTVGTLISFGLGTALTSEPFEETFTNVSCETEQGFIDTQYDERGNPVLPLPEGCTSSEQSFSTTRTRTDRVWWLLAPNPFVIVADVAPRLSEPGPNASQREVDAYVDAQSVDVLGQLGDAVRDLRRPPGEQGFGFVAFAPLEDQPQAFRDRRVWPYGLAFDVLLGAGALLLTTRRLRTPSRDLPRGQRVA